jgi:hypothetical protein
MATYYSWSVFWGNPYSQPPDGQPRYLMKNVVLPNSKRWSGSNRPPCIDLVVDRFRSQGIYGWSIGLEYHDTAGAVQPRRWSESSKQKCRRTKLKNRLLKTVPLFADELYQQELINRPDYFGKESV